MLLTLLYSPHISSLCANLLLVTWCLFSLTHNTNIPLFRVFLDQNSQVILCFRMGENWPTEACRAYLWWQPHQVQYNISEAIHTCPEALIRLSELIKRSVNGFLVQFVHIFGICKNWNPEQKIFKVISPLVKFRGEKMGFWALFGFGLDWNWWRSENYWILSQLVLNIWSIGWNISK